MNDISVTQGVVRNLASALSKVDSSSLKHTERLELIASAFGWRSDAFMHALKQAEPVTGVERTPSPLDALGVRDIELWRRCMASKSGLFVVCGPTGSGKTTVITAMRDHLRRLRQDGLRDPRNAVHVVDGIDKLDHAAEACVMARLGHLVFATMHVGSSLGVHERLSSLNGIGHAADYVRGVMSLRLLRRKDGGGAVLISEVEMFDEGSPLGSPGKGVRRPMFRDMVEKVRSGVVGLDEIDRVFGSDVLRDVEVAIPSGR